MVRLVFVPGKVLCGKNLKSSHVKPWGKNAIKLLVNNTTISSLDLLQKSRLHLLNFYFAQRLFP